MTLDGNNRTQYRIIQLFTDRLISIGPWTFLCKTTLRSYRVPLTNEQPSRKGCDLLRLGVLYIIILYPFVKRLNRPLNR